MPRGDQTGPMGMGEMSGRGAGYCGGYGMPGYRNSGVGRGAGTGFFGGRGGRSRGWRHMFNATGLPGWMRSGGANNQMSYPKPDTAMEKKALQNQAQILRSELELIEKRLSEIHSEAGA